MITSIVIAFLKNALKGVIKSVMTALGAIATFVREHPKIAALIVFSVVLAIGSFQYGKNTGIKSKEAEIAALQKELAKYKEADVIQKKTIEEVKDESKKLANNLVETIKRNEDAVATIVKTYDKRLAEEKSKSTVIEVPYAIEIIKEGKPQVQENSYTIYIGPDGKPYCDRFSNTFLETVNEILGVTP